MLDGVVTWAEIDLGAIEHNLRAIQSFVGNNVEIFGVVKANAYGHGMVPVARAALRAGASRLAVHRLTEALELRKAGVVAPILVMGYTPASGAALVVQEHLTPSVITLEFARALSAAAAQTGGSVAIHLKVDSGMNRYGLLPAEVVPFANEIRRLPGIVLEGLYTHFATADWADQHYSREQLGVFKQVVAALRAAGIQFPLVHASNSAGIAYLPEATFNAVRPGISLYGVPPSTQLPSPFDLRPALSLKSRVSRVRDLPAGSAVSYNRTYIADRAIRAALVPIGYADGYSRILSNRGNVLIHGQRACVIGLVCMDQLVVDVSDIPDVRQDDEVVILGRQGNQAITVQEVASLAGTIPNEIFTSISSRVVRMYSNGGRSIPASLSGTAALEEDVI
jgi:alanine racemase